MNDRYVISRQLLIEALKNPRLVRQFEDQAAAVASTVTTLEGNVAATSALQDATVVTLSKNDAFTNERVIASGNGIKITVDDKNVIIETDSSVLRLTDGFQVTVAAGGDSDIVIPLKGILATRDNTETLTNKTLDAPKLSGLGNYANDAAAATGGVPVGGIYRNGSVVQVRVA